MSLLWCTTSTIQHSFRIVNLPAQQDRQAPRREFAGESAGWGGHGRPQVNIPVRVAGSLTTVRPSSGASGVFRATGGN